VLLKFLDLFHADNYNHRPKLLNFMKTTSLIAVYLVGLEFFYHIQWLMLAPFRVSNAFYLTLICQFLHIVLIFNNL